MVLAFLFFLTKSLTGCKITRDDKKTGTPKSTPLQWNRFGCSPLQGLIPCLEFTIEIQSNNLMYNPNKEIRDREFPIKIGKFSIKYYTY